MIQRKLYKMRTIPVNNQHFEHSNRLGPSSGTRTGMKEKIEKLQNAIKQQQQLQISSKLITEDENDYNGLPLTPNIFYFNRKTTKINVNKIERM